MTHAAASRRNASRNRADMVRDTGKTRQADENAIGKIGQRSEKYCGTRSSAFPFPIFFFLLLFEMPTLQQGKLQNPRLKP